jgi:hypothetical protein
LAQTAHVVHPQPLCPALPTLFAGRWTARLDPTGTGLGAAQEFAADQVNRQHCAAALWKAGDSERARAEVRGLLDADDTPRFIRADAHRLVTEISLDEGR